MAANDSHIHSPPPGMRTRRTKTCSSPAADAAFVRDTGLNAIYKSYKKASLTNKFVLSFFA